MKDEQLFKLVGKRIKELRLGRGWIQDEISRQFGFNYKHYQRIEEGRQNLELATLNKLAVAFDISIEQLLIFENSTPKRGSHAPKNRPSSKP
jgi:transcriptional regulator with XRE-family HTH domain